jgi:hypothetical protein
MRCVPDRNTPAGANDLGHRHVRELLAIARMAKEKSTASQLAEVQHIARKEQSIPEDWGKQVGVLARTD